MSEIEKCCRCGSAPYGYMSQEVRKISDLTGVPTATLYLIMTSISRLRQDGFTPAQIKRVIRALHPETMSGITFTSDLCLKLKDLTLIWKRHEGWVKR